MPLYITCCSSSYYDGSGEVDLYNSAKSVMCKAHLPKPVPVYLVYYFQLMLNSKLPVQELWVWTVSSCVKSNICYLELIYTCISFYTDILLTTCYHYMLNWWNYQLFQLYVVFFKHSHQAMYHVPIFFTYI